MRSEISKGSKERYWKHPFAGWKLLYSKLKEDEWLESSHSRSYYQQQPLAERDMIFWRTEKGSISSNYPTRIWIKPSSSSAVVTCAGGLQAILESFDGSRSWKMPKRKSSLKNPKQTHVHWHLLCICGNFSSSIHHDMANFSLWILSWPPRWQLAPISPGQRCQTKRKMGQKWSYSITSRHAAARQASHSIRVVILQ